MWTIGHSNRALGDFLGLLSTHGVELVADVRRHPGSRTHPAFARDPLAAALRERGLDYAWVPALGGRRAPRPDSANTAWRNSAFRGYADHMETEEFARGLDELLHLAHARPTAIMCAEALWWRCHRGLIADVLRWLGLDVIHILGPHSAVTHPYTGAARFRGGRLAHGP